MASNTSAATFRVNEHSAVRVGCGGVKPLALKRSVSESVEVRGDGGDSRLRALDSQPRGLLSEAAHVGLD
jgi:hypothetical protein